jgi:SAM-dependent methyltransferase
MPSPHPSLAPPSSSLAGLSPAEIETLVENLLTIGGLGRVLVIGPGLGLPELLRARGLPCERLELARPEPEPLAWPFPGEDADTALVIDDFAGLTAAHVGQALQELRRVVRRSVLVYLSSPTTPTPGSAEPASARDRAWWEQQFFAAGFRKHPLRHLVQSYESLEHPPGLMVFEPLPELPAGPGAAHRLEPAGPGGADLSRQSGWLAEATLARYELAARYVRPGDTVLDVGSQSGFGLYLLQRSTRAARFLGLEASAPACDYAQAHFTAPSPLLEYQCAEPLEALRALPDNSVHFITCFDTLERAADRRALLQECRRVLTPGGRFLVSVPNGWEDLSFGPTSEDLPFSWPTLKQAVQDQFLIEAVFQQMARGANGWAGNHQFQPSPRRLRSVSLAEAPRTEAEWWLVLGMKDPLARPVASYQETVFQNVADSGHVSVQYARFYQNPWLLHALVHAGYRATCPEILVACARRILDQAPPASPDAGAALCLLLYRAVEGCLTDPSDVELVCRQARNYLTLAQPNPHQLRWQISLAYALGLLEMRRGNFTAARKNFDRCAQYDVLAFSTHLATKTTDALFWSGWLALADGDAVEAERAWNQGLAFGERLRARPLTESLMNPEWPNLFDYGDGMRELIYALENVAKCANGLHCLRLQAQGISIRWDWIQNSFRFQHETVTRALRVAQARVARLCGEVDQARADLHERTAALDGVREELRARELQVVRLGAQAKDHCLNQLKDELGLRLQSLSPAPGERPNFTPPTIDTLERTL